MTTLPDRAAAILTDLDGATTPGDPAAYSATPGEFAARWNRLSQDDRADWLSTSVANSQAAVRAHVLGDDGLGERLRIAETMWRSERERREIVEQSLDDERDRHHRDAKIRDALVALLIAHEHADTCGSVLSPGTVYPCTCWRADVSALLTST